MTAIGIFPGIVFGACAIRQHGANQVAIIKSGAERTAAKELALASAVYPYLVGTAVQEFRRTSRQSVNIVDRPISPHVQI